MIRKTSFLSTITILAFSVALSQTPLSQDQYISSEAFSKMMLDHYNFTLVGSQTPTTGFKVETSKPSITLKGNINPKSERKVIINLELEGGLNNGLMQLFSGNTLSKYVKGNVGFNFLIQPKSGRLPLTKTEEDMTANAISTNRAALSKQLDTFSIIKTITDHDSFSKSSYAEFLGLVIKERSKDDYEISNFHWVPYPNNMVYYDSLIRQVLRHYGAIKASTGDSTLNDFKSAISDVNNRKINTTAILKDYDRIKDALLSDDLKLNNKQFDFEIELTKVNWVWKKLKWINFSVGGSNNSFRLYNPASTTLIDSSSFLYSFTGSFNYLYRGKSASNYHLTRGGVSLFKTNSTTDLQEFNYKKETVIVVSPGEELKSSKEGIAYVGELKEKMGFEVFGELFSAPWKNSLAPGLYARLSYRTSEAWLNKNKLSGDLGMIWNVANNDKESKNILTIVPYISWSNFLTEYKDAGKTMEKTTSDILSFNIKVGIPINVGK